MKNVICWLAFIFLFYICLTEVKAYTLNDVSNIYNEYGEAKTREILKSIGNCTPEEANSLIEISIHKKTNIIEPNAYQQKKLEKTSLGRVTSVIDGCTIKIDANSTLSLIGIVVPESGDSYSKIAAIYLRNLLLGETVYIEREPNQNSSAGYDNSFVYLYRYPDGLFINEEIIRQGYGKCYTRLPFKYMAKFQSFESIASKTPKGLWKLENNSYSPAPNTIVKTNPPINRPASGDSNTSPDIVSPAPATEKYETSENNYTSDKVYVNGYYRKDGTYVKGYYRRKAKR
ncbi:MAG: thermonuclease family protein [Planctomycetaceae bacterium]|nr:thermonuclease family protein [Planctomycetaceae bacterium]